MYVLGAEHPNRGPAHRELQRLISSEQRLVTDVEVFQEILHRYVAIGRRDAISPAFQFLTDIIDEVFPIDMTDLERARSILLAIGGLSARDAIHVATMERHGIGTVLTFDRGFDAVPGIRRLPEEA